MHNQIMAVQRIGTVLDKHVQLEALRDLQLGLKYQAYLLEFMKGSMSELVLDLTKMVIGKELS